MQDTPSLDRPGSLPCASSRPPALRCAAVLTAMLLVGVGFATGCEPREPAVSADLEEAIELVQLASRGYVPAEHAEEFDTVDVEAFRQATLAEARPRLTEALRNGTTAERVTAGQMLADIHRAAARHAAREAEAAHSALSADAANLATKLRNVAKLDNRIALLRQDRSAVQRELTAEREAQQQRRDQLASEREDLQREIAELRERRDEQRQRAEAQAEEANELRTRAFTLEGEEHYEMLDEAADVARRGSEADVEAERTEALLERREAERTAVENELMAIDAVLDDIAGQLEQWEEREQSRAERLEALEQEHLEAGEALLEHFAQVREGYQEQVEARFSAAGDDMAEAVELLEAAADRAQGARRTGLQRDLLAQQIAQVQVLVDHTMTAGSFGRTLAPLAQRGPTVMPEALDAAVLDQAYRELVERQEEAVLAGTGAAQAAQGLASELGNVAEDEIQRFADRQRSNLARYIERLNEHALR